MLKLHGFAVSNYYNKVKMVLLEKGVAFQEVNAWPDRSPALLEKSPLGKIPFLETPQGILCESQVQVEYIDAVYPKLALLPSDPFEAAKVNELIVFLELHMELVARELYAEVYFGGKVAADVKTRVQATLTNNIAAFAKLAKFSPFVAGAELTMADCVAAMHLPMIARATQVIYGKDLLADLPVADYLNMMGERPSVQKIAADREAGMAEFNKFKAKRK